MTAQRGLVAIVGILVLTLSVQGQLADRTRADLQEAIKLELVDGNLKAAVERFKVLAASSRPEIAAEALVHLAACYDTLGQRDEARAAYQRVAREYATQAAPAAAARAWLQAHPAPTTAAADRVKIEQLWTGQDVNLEGRPSPDGRYLAYIAWSNLENRLAVRDLRTGTSRLLTKHDGAENPLISPDGQQIAYRQGERDSAIRLISWDGTRSRELLRDDHRHHLQAWSPDGQLIAATAIGPDRTGSIVLISAVDGKITTLKSTGWRWATIGGFSADGRHLVYSLSQGDGEGEAAADVFVLSVDGKVQTPLVTGPADDTDPVWTPDGRHVVFLSNRSTDTALWSIRVANGRPEGDPVLVRSVAGIVPLGMTSDGAYYYGTRTAQLDAYVADFDPLALSISNPTRVTDRLVGRTRAPQVSPDGSAIAFIRNPGTGPEVAVRSMTTGQERTLTKLTGNVYGTPGPQWFPDGRSLFVLDKSPERTRMRKIDVQSGAERVLFEGPWEIHANALLSRDGRTLFYTVRNRSTEVVRLLRRDLAGGAETELYRATTSGIGFFGLSMSTDGRQLAFAVNVGGGERIVVTMPAEGGAVREIHRGPFDISPQGAMAWTPDNRHLIVTGKCGGTGRRLCALPVTGGPMKAVGPEMVHIESRMVSADGRRVAFTGTTHRSQELWVMRNLLPVVTGAR